MLEQNLPQMSKNLTVICKPFLANFYHLRQVLEFFLVRIHLEDVVAPSEICYTFCNSKSMLDGHKDQDNGTHSFCCFLMNWFTMDC